MRCTVSKILKKKNTRYKASAIKRAKGGQFSLAAATRQHRNGEEMKLESWRFTARLWRPRVTWIKFSNVTLKLFVPYIVNWFKTLSAPTHAQFYILRILLLICSDTFRRHFLHRGDHTSVVTKYSSCTILMDIQSESVFLKFTLFKMFWKWRYSLLLAADCLFICLWYRFIEGTNWFIGYLLLATYGQYLVAQITTSSNIISLKIKSPSNEMLTANLWSPKTFHSWTLKYRYFSENGHRIVERAVYAFDCTWMPERLKFCI